MKKWAVLAVIVTLAASVLAACSGKRSDSGSDASEGKNYAPAVVSMMTQTHPTWPYREDWPIWRWIKDAVNVEFKVEAIDSSVYPDSFALAVASGTLPDITFVELADAVNYGQQGAFADLNEHLDRMPNLKAYLERNPQIKARSTAPNGSLYMAPHDGVGFSNQRTWMYRQDIFEKHNLAVPATWDELYEVSKQLKALYPDSFPLTFRQGMGQMRVFATAFNTWFDIYPDLETGEVRFGPIEDNYKTMVEYLHKFYTEGLMPPDWLSIDVNGWAALMASGQGFIAPDYIGRIEFLNNQTEEGKFAFMAPPAGGENGAQYVPEMTYQTTGFGVFTGSSNQEAAFRYIDFLYSDEGVDRMSWGKEGETYDVVNGERVMKDDFIDFSALRTETGIATWGTYGLFDVNAGLALVVEEERPAYTEAAKYNYPMTIIEPNFLAEEQETVTIKFESIRKHRDEMVAKFILGERPLSQWDQYVAEIRNLGLQEVIDLYQKAWDRQNK
jgi:putative aldouronate transport system substrate-binding protein